VEVPEGDEADGGGGEGVAGGGGGGRRRGGRGQEIWASCFRVSRPIIPKLYHTHMGWAQQRPGPHVLRWREAPPFAIDHHHLGLPVANLGETPV
jgi:hypothetical protein